MAEKQASGENGYTNNVAEPAFYLLARDGVKGKRYCLPNSRVLIHQPWLQGLGGQATDIDIHAKDILRMRHRLWIAPTAYPTRGYGFAPC